MAGGDETLTAGFTLEYAYKRSLGPVYSRFFTSLRDGHIEGRTTRGGKVLVPPAEADALGHATEGWAQVDPVGTVCTWSWLAAEGHALALIKLDGADTALMHRVQASEDQMATGMRVRAHWIDEPAGTILDIDFFVPEFT